MTPVTLRRRSVAVADDPYKKYWWVILFGCAATGAWLCLPMMETSVGGGRFEPKPAADASGSGEEGLAAAAGGAAGHAYDLTMGASGAKTGKGAFDAPESMLFQAPEDASAGAAAVGAPVGTASGGASGSLASALKNVGRSDDASGWSGEKAQRGFAAPHIGGGALSGLGSISGGRGGSAGAGAFGVRGAQTQSVATRGLVDDGSQDAAAAEAARRSGMGALGLMAAQANKAALNRSGDAAAGGMSRLFDGAKTQNQIGSAGGPGGGGAYEALDQAPINLKVNPSDLDAHKITEPPAAPVPPSQGGNSMQQMAMMVAGVAVSALIGGMIPGVGGQIIGMAAMMAIMQMSQQQQASAQTQQQAAQQRAGSVLH